MRPNSHFLLPVKIRGGVGKLYEVQPTSITTEPLVFTFYGWPLGSRRQPSSDKNGRLENMTIIANAMQLEAAEPGQPFAALITKRS